jgi:hypothetical protein
MADFARRQKDAERDVQGSGHTEPPRIACHRFNAMLSPIEFLLFAFGLIVSVLALNWALEFVEHPEASVVAAAIPKREARAVAMKAGHRE